MSLRVSLAPPRARTAPAPALLDKRGARVVLGARGAPIVPARDTLFGPRGACFADGALFVCDTGHHRVMAWNAIPEADHAPADFVLGQPSFAAEGRNGFNVPTGIAAACGVLALADAWNHRVLLWHGLPRDANQPADVVLGQADFSTCLPNRGLGAPRADTLNWCYGVALVDGRLLVADTGNRRVLLWERIPERHGQPADLILGQPDFVTRDALAIRWPHAIVTTEKRLFVADAGTNRILGWRGMPRGNNAPCDFMLGETGLDYYPRAGTLSMPYGLALLGDTLVVADTAHSRLLGFSLNDLSAPGWLAGQDRFEDKGDNRWQAPARDSLCWPYGVAACGRLLAVADSGNNRVLLWERA
jgi:hypothetical protein